MNSKQILVGILIVAMVGAGISQLMPTLNIMASNAFSLIGIIIVVGLLGYGLTAFCGIERLQFFQ